MNKLPVITIGGGVLLNGRTKAFTPIGGFGDATPDDVTLGKTFTSDAGIKRTGTQKELIVTTQGKTLYAKAAYSANQLWQEATPNYAIQITFHEAGYYLVGGNLNHGDSSGGYGRVYIYDNDKKSLLGSGTLSTKIAQPMFPVLYKAEAGDILYARKDILGEYTRGGPITAAGAIFLNGDATSCTFKLIDNF